MGFTPSWTTWAKVLGRPWWPVGSELWEEPMPSSALEGNDADALRWWIHLSWENVLLRTRMIYEHYELYRLLTSELLRNLKIFEVCCCTMLNSEARNLVLVALRPLLLADDLHHSAG